MFMFGRYFIRFLRDSLSNKKKELSEKSVIPFDLSDSPFW